MYDFPHGMGQTTVHFACECGHAFELEAEQEGQLICCPDCGRFSEAPIGATPLAQLAPAPPPVLAYARPDTPPTHDVWDLPKKMLALPSLWVLIFGLLYHIFLVILRFISGPHLFFVIPGGMVVVLCIGLVAHIGVVIEETGPEEIDELPRLLRGLEWRDDWWLPFRNVVLAMALSYGPAMLLLRLGDAPGVIAAVAAALAGTVVAPALLLTCITAGTLNNLRPDRVLGVMRAGGKQYQLAVVSWILAAGIYGFGLYYTNVLIDDAEGGGGSHESWEWWLSYSAIIAGFYLMNLFCWQMGLYYRNYHELFSWVWQKYEHIHRSAGAELPKPGDTTSPHGDV